MAARVVIVGDLIADKVEGLGYSVDRTIFVHVTTDMNFSENETLHQHSQS